MTCRDLVFNVLYRTDASTLHFLLVDSLDRLGDSAWPRDLPLHDLPLLRSLFFILLNKDMELKEAALAGFPPTIAPLDRRKAEAFYLALEEQAIRPFLSKDTVQPDQFIDSIKHLYHAV